MALRSPILHILPLLVSAIWPFGARCEAAPAPTADLIITNAKVWTVDKSHPTAEAVAVLGQHIVAVGSNAEVRSLAGCQNPSSMHTESCCCPASMMRTCISSAADPNSTTCS